MTPVQLMPGKRNRCSSGNGNKAPSTTYSNNTCSTEACNDALGCTTGHSAAGNEASSTGAVGATLLAWNYAPSTALTAAYGNDPGTEDPGNAGSNAALNALGNATSNEAGNFLLQMTQVTLHI